MSEFTCQRCGTVLEKPGDYCLVCRTPNADGVVAVVHEDHATLTILDQDRVVGETTVTTTRESGELRSVQRRNFAGLIIDEIRRKRPVAVYVSGDRDILSRLHGQLHYPCLRVGHTDPVAEAIDRRRDRSLEVVETQPADKLGGSHSTLIGGREGRDIVMAAASHPHVKRIIPGPIETGGAAGGGVRGKVTRTDGNGNLRLLLRDGSTVQEIRVVTTAMDRERGERIRADLATLVGREQSPDI